MRSIVAWVVGGVVVWSGGCARQAPPPGGPVDDTAPAIASTSPALFETNVALDAPLVIEFSEPVDRTRSEDAVIVRPSVEWARREWRDRVLTLDPRGGWEPETTYSVLLRRGVVDARDIPMKEAALIAFSTGSEVRPGRVAGTVRRLGLSDGSTLVFAFTSPVADTNDVSIDEAIAVAEPDANGSFLLAGLPLDTPLEIGAHFDVNENRAFDGTRDLYCRARSPVVADSAGGPLDVDIPLVFNDTLGSIRAVVVDSTCIRLSGLIARGAAVRESLFAARDSVIELRRVWEARVDSIIGLAVAPLDEIVVETVVTPTDDGETPEPDRPDALRATADSIRAELAALDVPDSAAIAARGRLGSEAAGDSVYCRAPLVLRFEALTDTTTIAALEYERSSFDVTDVPPGAYRGRVWRDLITDETFDPDREPGSAEPITIWVPPGEAGEVDTLRFRGGR